MRASVASAYAEALAGLAQEKGQLEEVSRACTSFLQALRSCPELERFLMNPAVDRHRKQKVIMEKLSPLLPDLFVRFLACMIEKGDQLYLTEALSLLPGCADELLGRLHVEVRSARPLPSEIRDRLREALSVRLEKEIVLHDRVDPALLGGVVIRYRDRVLDASLSGQLARLRLHLKECAARPQEAEEP